MAKSKKFIMIKEYKQMMYLENLHKKNTIDLDKYFKYSGKIEVGKKFKEPKGDYVYKHRIIINNDMSKYKF